jgi:ATP-dependent RNA helicase SUPV3L1/SUV3
VTTAHPKERNLPFRLDLSLAVSIGLEPENARRLLGSAGFRCERARALPEGAHGAPAPDRWYWRPRRPGETQDRRGERRHGERSKSRPEGERKPRPEGKQPDKRQDRRPQQGKPGGSQRRDQRPAPKVDTGPARAGGAFDKLADLLKG